MGGAVQHVNTTGEFNKLLSSTQYVVADFYADWCGPCKAIAPKYTELAEQLSIPNYITFTKINVDKAQALAQEYGVVAMPTFAFFKDGKRVKVNGDLKIEGADWPRLKAASEKMGRLAEQKAEAAGDLK